MRKLLFMFLILFGLGIFTLNSLPVEASGGGDLVFTNAIQLGGNGYVDIRDAIFDSSDNYFIIGMYTGTVDFDPGVGVDNKTASGTGNNMFVTKFDSSMSYQWTYTVGGTGSASLTARDIFIDGSGNIYLAGHFSGVDIDFDGGAGTALRTSSGLLDAFALKINSSATFQWVNAITGSGIVSSGGAVADSSGNVFVVGGFDGTVDFDLGAGTQNRSSVSGSTDGYIAKYDSTGAYVDVKTFGSVDSDNIRRIAIDSSNNIYVGGYFRNTIDFDPGAGTQNRTSAGGADAVLASYDSSLAYRWVNTFGGASGDYDWQVKLDGDSNVFMSGDFYGDADFDPGAGTDIKIFGGTADTYVTKYTTAGVYQYTVTMGFGYDWYSEALAVDTNGDFYLGTYYGDWDPIGPVDFDPGAGTDINTPSGPYDVAVTKFRGADGTYVDTYNLATAEDEEVFTIATNSSNEFYTTGFFIGTIDFDTSASVFELTTVGGDDAFILIGQEEVVIPPTVGESLRVVLRDSELAGVSSDVEYWFDTITDVTNGSILYLSYDQFFTGGSAITTSDVSVTCDADGADPLSGTGFTAITVTDSQNGYMAIDLGNNTCANYVVVDINGTGGNQLTNPVDPGNYSWSMIMDIGGNGSTDYQGATLAYVQDENDVTITANVIPVIDLELYEAGVDSLLNGTGANTCELGVLSINTVNSCNYDVGTGTNNTAGVSVYIQSDGELRDGSGNTIDACSGTNCDSLGGAGIDAGEEEYGVYISELGGGEYTAAGSFNTQYQAVPTTETLFASSSTTGSGTTTGSTTQRFEVTHGVSISTATAQGSYSQLVTYTAFTN